MNHSKTFSIIGAGRVGKALAIALVAKGWTCCSVISRSRRSAGELARLLNDVPASTDIMDLVGAGWVFVCCPDDVLESLAHGLANLSLHREDAIVAHTSGSVSSEVFAPLAAKKALICSIHPALSLSGTPRDWQKFRNATFAIEGRPEALAYALLLLEELGGRAVAITAGSKLAYHLACVLVSNYLVTLHAVALQIARVAGADASWDEDKTWCPLLVELS